MGDSIQEDLKNQLKIFHKLSNMYKWTWKEFTETPWWVITGLCKLLDDSADDLEKFISYAEYSEYKNLKRLHGTKEEEKLPE